MGFWDKVKQNAHFAGEKRQCTLCTNFAYRVQEYKFTSLTIKDKEYNVKEYDAIIQTKIRYIYKKYGIIDARFK